MLLDWLRVQKKQGMKLVHIGFTSRMLVFFKEGLKKVPFFVNFMGRK